MWTFILSDATFKLAPTLVGLTVACFVYVWCWCCYMGHACNVSPLTLPWQASCAFGGCGGAAVAVGTCPPVLGARLPAPAAVMQGSTRRDEQEVQVDRVKMVVVDQKLAPQKE